MTQMKKREFVSSIWAQQPGHGLPPHQRQSMVISKREDSDQNDYQNRFRKRERLHEKPPGTAN